MTGLVERVNIWSYSLTRSVVITVVLTQSWALRRSLFRSVPLSLFSLFVSFALCGEEGKGFSRSLALGPCVIKPQLNCDIHHEQAHVRPVCE